MSFVSHAMNPTRKTFDRAAAAALALILAVLMTPAEAQRAKTGKPAAPVYARINVKYNSTSSMRATAPPAVLVSGTRSPAVRC